MKIRYNMYQTPIAHTLRGPTGTYHDLMRHVLDNDVDESDHTGTGACSMFSYQMRSNLSEGSPLLTTKKLYLRSTIYELFWLLRGDTNIKYLEENNVSIWGERADENGNSGPVYGCRWRSWPAPDGRHTDQIVNVVEQVKKSPDSRRLIVSIWSPALADEAVLSSCHALFQLYVTNGKLPCRLYWRGADIFLGMPLNIAGYTLLATVMAQMCGLEAGEFIYTLGDVYLYSSHIEQARLQLNRDFRSLPTMKINPEIKDLFAFKFKDFELKGYDPHPHIKAAVSV